MKKNIYFAIVIILFLASLFLFSQNKMLKKEILALNERIAVLENEINEVKNKPPLGWKEYTDEKYKFKVWYPEIIDRKILMYGSNGDTYSLISFYPDDRPSNDIPRNLLTIYI